MVIKRESNNFASANDTDASSDRKRLSIGVVSSCLGVILAAFIPIAILLIENGVETRIDRMVIINNMLSFDWFFGTLLVIIFISIFKMLVKDKNLWLSIIVDFVLIVSLVLITSCSWWIYSSSMQWLNDVPMAVDGDSAYTSNSTLDASMPSDTENSGFLAVRPNTISSYKKRARIAYIKSADSIKEQELRWEIFFNDANTYKYEGKNDFWLYVREYYLFLNSIGDDDKDVALRGFENLSTHVKDIGISVDDHRDCLYVGSTLLMLRFENTEWRAELWAKLVGEYMTVALTNTDVCNDVKACWLGSLAYYMTDGEFDIGGDGHLELLAKVLWDAYNSFEVQYSDYHINFYPDVPHNVVDFYTTLFDSSGAEGFYKYVKDMRNM